ncbi:MAG: hypothetical protein ABJA98_09405 [Acidobacteriota bacterium]
MARTQGRGQCGRQFRHTVAQGVLDITGNLKVTQELLGHAHLSITADLYITWIRAYSWKRSRR